MRRDVVGPTAVPLVCALVLAGCGGAPPPANRRSVGPGGGAAEPAVAPAVAVPPAGRLIAVGGMPEGIVFDRRSRLVAVGLRAPGRLALVDPRAARVLRIVPLAAGVRHLQIAQPSGVVLVPEEDARVLAEVALPSGAVVATVVVGRQPHDAAYARGREFVGNEFAGTVSVIESGRVVATLGGLRQPGGLAVDGRTLAVVDVATHTVNAIDVATLRREGALPAGSGPTHVVVDSRRRLVVVDTRGDSLDLFSPSPLAVLGRVPLPGTPYGIASDPARGRIWVTLTARNQLVEFGVTRRGLRRLATFPTGRQANTVTVDAGNGDAVVSNRVDGTLEVIRPPPARATRG